MGIIEFFVLVLIIGLIVYLINRFAPIDPVFKNIILVAAVVFLLIVLLNAMGIIGRDYQIPRLK